MAIKFGKVANNPGTDEKSYAPAIQMGIDNAPASLIVKYITDMYSFPLEAAIRETVSNAIDAAGRKGLSVSEGVKVEYAGEYGEWFKVTDKGVGMDYDTLVNVYTQYGVSDKRDDANSTGAFGLGAKSPLAYTNEFRIITKAEGQPCYFVVAYRTSDDNFIAETPVEITAEGTAITVVRDGAGNIVPRTIDAKGNIVDGSGRRDTFVVSDPFTEGETGTCVSFPVRGGQTEKARSIIKGIDDLLVNTGNGSICGNDETEAAFYEIASTSMADADGDTIPVKIYATGTSTWSTRAAYFFEDCLVNGDPYGREGLFGFKVGDWFYPATGSSWTCDGNRGMDTVSPFIVDVPSKALPFIPSRDTIRTDNGNANANAIIAFAVEQVLAFFKDASNAADMVAWQEKKFANQPNQAQRAFNELFRCDKVDTTYEVSGNNVIVHLENRKTQAIATVSCAMNGIDGFAGYTLAELAASKPVVLGQVECEVDRTKNKGVYVVSNEGASKILGATKVYGYRSAMPAYAFAKSKTVGDKLVGIGYKQTNTCEYAAKSNRDNTQVGPTACFPAGCGLVQAVCDTYNVQSFIIIDGRDGISKVRNGIGRVFDNAKALSSGRYGIYAIVPPKGNGTNWTDAEMKEQVAFLTKIGKAFCDSVTYIPADKVAEYLVKTAGISDSERSDLDKMFNNNRHVSIKMNGENKQIRGSWSSDNRVSAAFVNDPTSWGLVVGDKNSNNVWEFGVNVAKAAIALGFVPETITDIACISSHNFNAKRAEAVKELGALVIYDATGMTDALISAGSMTETSRRYSNSVAYSGDVPNDVNAYIRHIAFQNADKEVVDIISSKCNGGRYWGGYGKAAYVEEMVATFSFGKANYTSRASEGELPEWRAEIINEMEIVNKNDDAMNLDKLKEDLEQVASIWSYACAQSGLRLDYSTFNKNVLSRLAAVGAALGIDNMVDAYYNGVPMSDILI